MSKRDLVEALSAAHPDLTKSHLRGLLEAMFEAMGHALTTEGRHAAPGFGTLTVESRPPRAARNPRTGERVAVSASKSVRFKPAAELRAAIERAGGT